jgi:hypothetical protein
MHLPHRRFRHSCECTSVGGGRTVAVSLHPVPAFALSIVSVTAERRAIIHNEAV